MEQQITHTSNTTQIIVFLLGNEEYAVEILKVQEIIKIPEQITKIPNIPEFVEGVINLRGEVVPIVNLHKKFGIKEKNFDEKRKIVIINLNNQCVGIIVDGVSEVRTIEKSMIADMPQMFTQIDYEYLSGVIKMENRLIILLKLDSLFVDIEKNISDWITKRAKVQN